MSEPSKDRRRLLWPVVIGIVIAAGGISAAAIAITTNNGSSSVQTKSPYPSIDVEMPKTTYNVGERLNFTINTYGMCATPNVTIARKSDGVVLYDNRAVPTHCPALAEGNEKLGRPHFAWTAEHLQQTFSDEYFGGSGYSTITTNAAITLKRAGNYTVSASLLDNSKSVSKEVTVIGNDSSKVIGPTRMNLTSLDAYTPTGELIGKLVPQMKFKRGEQVMFNATFINPSISKLEGIIMTLGIRDANENPLPDDIAIVRGDAAPKGTLSVQNSWLPEKMGDYSVMIFSITKADLKSTIPTSPVIVVPIKVEAG